MTTPGLYGSQSESHQQHLATSSTLVAPPSSPRALLRPQPKPPTPLPPQTTRSKSVPLTSTTSKTPIATTKRPPKPTFSKISSLYQYTWERIDDLKLITGALCERLIALEDTVATLDEEDSMEIFTKKAFDMATEGQLIAMIAEQFKETGSLMADRAMSVGLVDVDWDGNGNGNGKANGNVDGKGDGSGKAEK
ncbi:hypothetical protein SMACR_06202 [Sordaria macrospora]|uniref:WGS project CABT00000000 data, contig 2.3 n=2 Tax=Sordaria macrospora TaxID=5147 RepID=F7VP54_SORMK|nr:uncharacterized protein SMAC_06202 [Sordaria macrospora k-hell]KAA8632020.1 hypothetical protein SMACR_06202 [Sordaria macrospora]WPJ64672.1 hypothetical protein SMAC4_06202 [Sordaria macrospora]CCC07281.1 unnamed protein product [Sordaria macrospora k-hell]